MKLKTVTLIVAIVFCSFTFGQNGKLNTSTFESTRQSNQIFQKLLNTKEKVNPIELSDIKGSPYMPETFLPGVFYYKDEKPANLMLRYNMYDDEIEALEDNGKISAFLKVDGSKFVVMNKTIQPYTIIDNGIEKKANLILLIDGKLKLLQRKQVLLIKPEKAINPNQMSRAAKFLPKETYYFQIEDGDLIVFNGKKKDLLLLFPDKETELKSFLKKEKINLKKQEGLEKVVAFLNNENS